MKKLNLLFSLCLFAGVVLFSSCDDSETPEREFSSGVLVVNEGNFTDADGTVSFFDPASGNMDQDIFTSQNGGQKIISIIQSITVNEDLAYIVANTGNRVEVVNAKTFVSAYTLNDVMMPRYFTVLNGKGYLTEWVSYTDPGRVSVVDLEKREVTTTITTDYGAECIIAVNGKLYVSNNFANTVSVIDPADNDVIKTIDVGDAPGEFVVDKEDKLWVVCSGGYDLDYNPLNNGMFKRINPATDEVDKTVELNMNVSGRIAIDKERDGIFFLKGKSIYLLSISATEAPEEALLTEDGAVGFYGIGFDAEDEIIYASDSKGFVGNGTVYRYTKDGTVIDNFTSGRGPNGFVFRHE